MKKIFYILFALIMVGCATIPKQTVEMSNLLGQQIDSLRVSNESIINYLFDLAEKQVVDYLDNDFFPEYVELYFEEPEIDSMWNAMVASNNPLERKRAMLYFNNDIQGGYKKTYDELLVPLRKKRQEIIEAIRVKFYLAESMNYVITRNISSINDVQETISNYVSKIIDIKSIDSIITNTIEIAKSMVSK